MLTLTSLHQKQVSHLLGTWFSEELHHQGVTDIIITSIGRIYVYTGGVVTCRSELVPEKNVISVLQLFADAGRVVINSREHSLAMSIEVAGILLRIQGHLPPVVPAACLSIRVASRVTYRLKEFIPSLMTKPIASKLSGYVKNKKNIMIGGATGSGKTTLLKALVEEIPQEERLLIIEDTPEIFPSHENCLKLRTYQGMTTREAVQYAMRHRPDRIIVGEVRDGAAYELLKAFVTGHGGGLFTIHASNLTTMYTRLAHLTMEVSNSSQDELVRESLDVAVHLKIERNKRILTIKEDTHETVS